MSAELRIDCTPAGNGWLCRVDVTDGAGSTRHDVTLTASDLARLAAGESTPGALVEESFRFLLEREPKESILRTFDITMISRYFPEYERDIRRRLTSAGEE